MKLCQGNKIIWFNPETDQELQAEVLQVRVKKVQILTVDLEKHWVPVEDTQLEALPWKTPKQKLLEENSITPSNLDSERDLPVIEDSITEVLGSGDRLETNSITEVLVNGDRIKEDSITEVLSDRIRFMGDRVRVKSNGALGTVKFFGNRLVTVHFDGELHPRGVDRKFLEKVEAIEDSVIEDSVIEDSVIETPVIEDAVIEDAVIEDAVIEDAVIEDAVIEDAVIETPVIETPVIEDAVIESYPVTLGTYQKGKHTYHRISYRDGSRVKHHHVTGKKVDEIRNAIASRCSRNEILSRLNKNGNGKNHV